MPRPTLLASGVPNITFGLLLWDRLSLCCWRHALRKRGFNSLPLAAVDPSADPELVKPRARGLPKPCACAVLSELAFLE